MQNDPISNRTLNQTSPGDSSSNGSPVMSGNTISRSPPEAWGSIVQAGPLPAKRGEIGYVEPPQTEERGITDNAGASTPSGEPILAPATHPADRTRPATPTNPPSNTPTNDNASTCSVHSTHSKFLTLLRPKRIPTLYGIRLTTLSLFVLHLAVLAATIAGWALVIQHMSAASSSSGSGNGLNVNSAQIFVHVAFGVASLAQLIFLERRIYRMRAERYCHLHSSLPMHRQTGDGNRSLPLAPWLRPPLPTYAAALAQSGVGTGDVEDNEIAVVPPPAYGNTRGSMLLLSGFMSDTMRVQRTEARVQARERANTDPEAEGALRASWVSGTSRPVSYMSHDSEWEERSDGLRALRLADTLARLEEARD